MTYSPDHSIGTNKPVWAFSAMVLFCGTVVVLAVTDNMTTAGLFVAMIVSTMPSLVAAVASERAARDIRNSVVESKAKAGAKAAIAETGVVLRDGPAVAAQLQALHTLIEDVRGRQAVATDDLADGDARK